MNSNKYIITPLGRKIPNPNFEKKPVIQIHKLWPAFWTITGVFSLLMNAILIAMLLSLGNQLFALKSLVEDQLIGGLYENFILMDESNIQTTIPVSAQVPAKFNLPLDAETVVVLREDTYIPGATVTLNTGGLNITNAPTNILLPAGTKLPIQLSLEVPVDQKIPVDLNVNVDIPLDQTDLHIPFTGLQNVVSPYYDLLGQTPDSWGEILCGIPPARWCEGLIPQDNN